MYITSHDVKNINIHDEKNFQRSSASSPGANPVDSSRFGPRIEGRRGNDP
jgi:hypothetical protein